MDDTVLPPTSEAIWVSDDTNILTVTNGTAHGVAVGKANVTASMSGVTTPPVNITVTDTPVLGELTVTATARTGGQTLTVTEPVAADTQRRYQITDADKQPTVTYDMVCAKASGWNDYPENGQISGKENQVATVVDCLTSSANARRKGSVTLPAPLA